MNNPQDIAPGNNPDKLTNAQVGEGYRLLTTEEIEARKAHYCPQSPLVERWTWSEWDSTAWAGTATSRTYRVPVSAGSFMPESAEAEPVNGLPEEVTKAIYSAAGKINWRLNITHYVDIAAIVTEELAPLWQAVCRERDQLSEQVRWLQANNDACTDDSQLIAANARAEKAEQERDQLRAEVERLKGVVKARIQERQHQWAEEDRLRTQLAAALEDKERLDWLEACTLVAGMHSPFRVVTHHFATNGGNIRAAIDDAMPGPHQWHSNSPAAKAIDAARKEVQP